MLCAGAAHPEEVMAVFGYWDEGWRWGKGLIGRVSPDVDTRYERGLWVGHVRGRRMALLRAWVFRTWRVAGPAWRARDAERDSKPARRMACSRPRIAWRPFLRIRTASRGQREGDRGSGHARPSIQRRRASSVAFHGPCTPVRFPLTRGTIAEHLHPEVSTGTACVASGTTISALRVAITTERRACFLAAHAHHPNSFRHWHDAFLLLCMSCRGAHAHTPAG